MDEKTDSSATSMRGKKTFQKVGTKVERVQAMPDCKDRLPIQTLKSEVIGLLTSLQQPCLHRQVKREDSLIKESAIQRKSDGKVWTGHRHGDVIRKIVSEEHIETVTHSEFIQGFITDDGQFVNRQEAFKIAMACDQIINKEDPWAAPTLMSEDLY